MKSSATGAMSHASRLDGRQAKAFLAKYRTMDPRRLTPVRTELFEKKNQLEALISQGLALTDDRVVTLSRTIDLLIGCIQEHLAAGTEDAESKD